MKLLGFVLAGVAGWFLPPLLVIMGVSVFLLLYLNKNDNY